MDGFIFVSAAVLRCLVLLFCLVLPMMVSAAEISAFRLTDMDGFLALRYFFDEHTSSDQLIESNPTFQEELSLSGRAYVYHPNMLNMNLSASVLYDQSDFENLQGESSDDTQRYNYFAYLNFLEKKPYPLTLYYDQQNPSVSTGLSGRFIQENTKYGFDFSLLEPFSPIQLTLSAFQLTSQGEGRDQLVDDVQDQANIRLYHAYGTGDFFQLSHQINTLDSRSGSPNLPIQERNVTNESSVLTTRNVFGDNEQVQLNNTISYNTQDEFPKREDFRFNPNLTWQHSQDISSFYRYDFSDVSEDFQDTKSQKLTLGMAKASDALSYNFDFHGEEDVISDLQNLNYGGLYSLSYRQPMSIGELLLSYSGSYDRYDQNTDLIHEPDEPHTLIGLAPVFLLNDFIDVSSIKVRNAVTAQLYDAADYIITPIGSRVELKRSLNSNIFDDQVVVEYNYETGGAFEYELIGQNVSLNLDFARYYDVYLRYVNRRQELLEGDPTIELNSINRSTVGFRADRPLSNGITLGGEASYENSNEDITSYTKENYDAFMELPLPRLTDVRIAVRRSQVDNENSFEDVDLTGYILRINSQPGLRTKLTYESSYETDTGSTIDRLTRNHRLAVGWRVRQLSVSFTANYIDEEQGGVDRERWAVKFIAKREFN